jgi:hypothetical protein
MCGRHALFPTSLKIELDDTQTDGMLYRGGSSNVLKHIHQGQEVAVKTLRISASIDSQAITYVGCQECFVPYAIIDTLTITVQRFCKEFVLWNTLRHANVLPLIGVILTETEFTMVSEWMPDGNINQFVKEHQGVNRFGLVSSPSNLPQSLFIVDNYVAFAVERCCEGLNLHA